MSYPFPPDIQQLLAAQMASGNYQSEDDLLRDALKAFADENSSEIDPVVVAGIRRGLADVAAGRVRAFSEFDAEFRAKHGLRDE